MPLVLNATPGDDDANGYITLAEGDSFAEAHLNGDIWSDEGDDIQTQAVVQATSLLDQYFEWIGSTASSTQSLLWPRDGAVGKNGYQLASDEIPEAIKKATWEYARQLISALNAEKDLTLDSEQETQGVKRVKAGSVDIEFTGLAVAKVVPDAVIMLVGPLGTLKGKSSGPVRLGRA